MGRFASFLLKNILGLTSTEKVLSFAAHRYANLCMVKDTVKGQSMTYGLFWEHVMALAHFIESKNLPKDVSIGYCGKNDVSYHIVRAACSTVKRPFLSVLIGYDTDTIVFLLKQAECRLLFYNGDIDTTVIMRYTPHLIQTESKEFQDIISSPHPPYKKLKRGNRPFKMLNLSSATTSKLPKIIIIPDQVWVNSLYNYIDSFEDRPKPGKRFLCLTPFTGAGSVPFLPMSVAGSCHILSHPKTPQDIINVIESENIDFVYLTPAYFTRLITYCFKTNQRPKCQFIVGSDRLNPYALRFAIKQLGMDVVTSYGLAEVLPPLTYNRPTADDDIEAFASVGAPFPNVKIEALKDPQYHFRDPRIGRIKIKANTIAEGYLNNREETSMAFQDGFLTSDYGYFDKQKRLHILGRELEVLEINSQHILSSEIEAFISSLLPYIFISRAIMEKGKLVIFIETASIAKEDIQTDKITSYITTNIEKEFGTRPNISFLDTLPTTAPGKINILALKAMDGLGYGA